MTRKRIVTKKKKKKKNGVGPKLRSHVVGLGLAFFFVFSPSLWLAPPGFQPRICAAAEEPTAKCNMVKWVVVTVPWFERTFGEVRSVSYDPTVKT